MTIVELILVVIKLVLAMLAKIPLLYNIQFPLLCMGRMLATINSNVLFMVLVIT